MQISVTDCAFGMSTSSLHRGHDLLRRVGQAVGGDELRRRFRARIFLPSSTSVPSRRTTSGTLKPTALLAATMARGDRRAAGMMPPKMLTSTAFTFGSERMMRKASVTCSLVGAAADVEEVRRLAAVQLDDVHRAHRQAGAVDQAADVAVELDVATGPCCWPGLRPGLLRPGRAARPDPCGGTWRCRRR